MSDFHNVHFPWYLAFGSRGGPKRLTEIVPLASGAEKRNSPKRHSRREYQATVSVKTYAEVDEIISFFEERRGRLHSFRFKDKTDFSTAKTADTITATDQIIGIGNGTSKTFQLIKSYGSGDYQYDRPITKPHTSSVIIGFDGAIVDEINYTVSELTGEVEFDVAPPVGAIITAGFEFDVPVRFDTDHLDIIHDDYGAAQITELPLIEVLDHV